MKAILFLIMLAVVGCLVFYGCNGADKNTQDKAQGALDTTKHAFQKAGKTIQQAADQSEETYKVLGPIKSSKDIDSSNVSVTTIGKTITMSGTVPTADQKAKAHKMAETNKDDGYTIEDDLKVAPKSTDGSSNTDKAPITDDQTGKS